MATVSDTVNDNNDDDKLKSIGQDGYSGHKVCGYKAMFATISASLQSISFQSRSARNIFVLVLRHDAAFYATWNLITAIISLPLTLLIGYVQGAEILRPVFDRLGMKYETWGRHAPHIIVCCLFGAIGTVMLWNPPTLVKIATTTTTDSLTLANATLVHLYTSEFNTKPTGYADGLDCSKEILLQNNTITVWGENGHNICETLISKQSYCWTMPNNLRKCVYPTSEETGIFWSIASILTYIAATGLLNLYQSASNELYPWKTERVQLFAMQLAITLPCVFFITILFANAQNQNELTNLPNGGQGPRTLSTIAGLITAVLTLFAIKPAKEARQPAKDGRNYITFTDYWSVLFPLTDVVEDDKNMKNVNDNSDEQVVDQKLYTLSAYERAVATRWLFLTWTCHAAWQSLFLFYISPFIYYVMMVEPLRRGTVNGMLAIIMIIITIFTTGGFGVYWGRRQKRVKRAEGRNPRNFAMICQFILVVYGVISYGVLVKPHPLDGTYAPNATLFVVLTACTRIFHGPFDFYFVTARGWVMDEDVHYGKGVRREAVYSGLFNFAFLIGGLIASIVLYGMYADHSICDTRTEALYISETCRTYIRNVYMIGLPVLKLCIGISMYCFPIKGKRLENLFEIQAKHQKVIPGTSAEKTIVVGNGKAGI